MAQEKVAVEDRLCEFPARVQFELKSPKALHIVPNLGLIKVKNGVSYGLGVLQDLGVAPSFVAPITPGSYLAVAILMGIRTRTSKLNALAPVGYCLLDSNGELTTISISDISRYMQNISNIKMSTPKSILGLELEFTTPCNIIYIGFQDPTYEATAGYRMKDGKVKRLLSKQVTRMYLSTLTNKDLTDIAYMLNDDYFQGRLSGLSVEWKRGGIAYSIVYSAPSTANDVNAGMSGFAPTTSRILISRDFLLECPHLFYEVLLHEMIHTLGTPDSHNTFFQRWVGIITGFEPELELATGKYTSFPVSKKWAGADEYVVKDNNEYTQFVCPTCGRIMYAGQGNVYRCKCGNSVQFSV